MEEEEKCKKRPPHLFTATASSPKKPRPPEPPSNGTSPVACAVGEAWSIDDDDDSLMKLLEVTERLSTVPFKVRFVPYPYSSPAIYDSCSSSYITINVGNEESCGSSFSDSDSSVMASVDLGGLSIAGPEIGRGAAEGEVGKSGGEGGVWSTDQQEMELRWLVEDVGGDWDWVWDDVDEALARFIGEEQI